MGDSHRTPERFEAVQMGKYLVPTQARDSHPSSASGPVSFYSTSSFVSELRWMISSSWSRTVTATLG
jgi:hypothetical protein